MTDERTAGDESPQPPVRRLKTVRASEIQPRRLRWLWDLRIVLGGLTLLAGREGLGKSTIAVWIAALVTRGLLDGELKGEPRTVIYVNSEDARDYTIRPRLEAAGADLDRVLFVDAVMPGENGKEYSDSITLPRDSHLLAETILEHEAALVVLDAATSTIDSRLDGDKDRQMRQGLEAIAREVGEATGAAVLGIVHFGKRDSSDTGKLILGSIAWSQVARSVLAVALDEDAGALVITRSKGNLGTEPPSLAVQLVSATVATPDGETSVGRVELLGETDSDARILLAAADLVSADERSQLEEAVQWLTAFLADRGGRAPAETILKAAKKDGIAEITLKRAKKKAGVVSRKVVKAWQWVLTEGGAVTSEDAQGDQDAQDARTCMRGDPLDPLDPLDALCEPSETCSRCHHAPAEILGLCRPCAYPTGLDSESGAPLPGDPP